MSILKTLAINGKLFRVTPIKVTHSVTLLASAWVGEGNRHYQVVEVEGITLNTKVNLQPTLEQLEVFRNKELTFTTKNENGVVTVYAIGDKPTMDYTMQVTLTEVVRDGNQAIWGDTVDTPAPSGGSGGGVSSWNDLTDKPFYEESREVEILPEQSIPVPAMQVSPAPFVLVEGETYRVVLNGVEHRLVCENSGGYLALNNLVQDENGEYLDGSFSIAYIPGELSPTGKDMVVCEISVSGDTATAAIYHMHTVLQQIDPKYLPMEAIDARIDEHINTSDVATAVDLSAYESNGTIVETFADGSSKTTTVEFDADGNPVKITDGDGNITELTW